MQSVQDRYKFKPFIGSSHHWALKELNKLDSKLKVLDVGPGSGAIGATLLSKGFKQLYAVEIDSETRVRLKDTYIRIEETLQPLQSERFDLILLLDVLEHTSAPEKMLQELNALLNPGGIILLSLPNVAHWSVRFSLLLGKFDYQDRGILDRTHLQFFTRKRARQLIKCAHELEIVAESSSIPPAEFVLPQSIWDNSLFRLLSQLRQNIAIKLPGLFAYQHLLMIKKR